MTALLSIDTLSLKLKDDKELLIRDFTLEAGSNSIICGMNGSGKSSFAQFLHEQLTDSALISFSLENEIIEEERRNDDSEFIEGGYDPGRTALEIITEDLEDVNHDYLNDLLSIFSMDRLMDSSFRQLSSGETRKALLIRALLSDPQIIIMDDPYAGLDYRSQAQLTDSLSMLMQSDKTVLLAGVYREDLPAQIERMILLDQGALFHGSKSEILQSDRWLNIHQNHVNLPQYLPELYEHERLPAGPLIIARDLKLSYNGRLIFKDLNWTMDQGEHWLIIGPNGAGKTSLLSMISADNTKAYGQDLTLFGFKRGTGESIWDIKKHIGIISGSFHRNYRVNISALKVILSGFFDSIGLYERVSNDQIKVAEEWLQLIGLNERKDMLFSKFSYGEQRLILLARAMVKLPDLLILDEPCQGLDLQNETQVLALIDYVAANSNTHILHVTHNKEEKLKCTQKQLSFLQNDDGSYRVEQSLLE